MSDERIAELENTILELSKELNRLVKWKTCPECKSEFYARVDVEPSGGGTAGRMYMCYECHYPNQARPKGPVFSSKAELLADIARKYPDAEKYEITIETLGNQTYTKGSLKEGVVMPCHVMYDERKIGPERTERLDKALKVTTLEEFTKLYPM